MARKVIPGKLITHGMLVYNDSPCPPEDKVTEAATHYTARFGRHPNVCFVHESDVPTGETQIAVVVTDALLPSHFWVGVR